MNLRRIFTRYSGLLSPPRGEYFRWGGEKRPPRRGEFYLSGAIPEVYAAVNDLDSTYHIMERYELGPGERVIDGEIYVRKAGQ